MIKHTLQNEHFCTILKLNGQNVSKKEMSISNKRHQEKTKHIHTENEVFQNSGEF